MLSPLTPAIHGIVIDEETKHPLLKCNIKAYWEIETHILIGVHTKTYKSFQTVTDSQGRFEIPGVQKPFGINGLGFLNRYSGIHIEKPYGVRLAILVLA